MKAFFGKHSEHITVFRLPSYSPDCNPIEKLWKKIKEKETRLRYFPSFQDIRNKADEAPVHFENMQEEILSLFGFYNRLPRKRTSGITINSDIKIEIKKISTA